MPFRWRSQGAVLGVLLTFIFFVVLQNDGLKSVMVGPGQESTGGEPTEAVFDEKIEQTLMAEMETFHAELKK
jgi:hypothetical protein